jgi:hypothetical protein
MAVMRNFVMKACGRAIDVYIKLPWLTMQLPLLAYHKRPLENVARYFAMISIYPVEELTNSAKNPNQTEIFKRFP